MIKRPEDPHQMYFVSRAELVSKEPLVRTIDQVVKSFDLGALYRRYSEGGRSFYDPAMMLKVLFFAYSDGVRSSREIAKRIGAELKRDVVAEGEDSYDEGLLSTAGGSDEAVKPRTEGGPSSDKVTDPDARFMKTSEGSLRPCYNSQIAVDKNQVIVVAEVSNCADDSVQFKSMIEQSQANVSGAPGVVLVDGGYYSGSNVKHSVSAGYELYMPVPQQRRVPDKRFEREAFVYDEATDSYRCPGGATLSYRSTQKKKDITTRGYAGSRTRCGHCPLRSCCTAQPYRRLYISEVYHLERQMQAKMASVNTW